MQTATVIRRHLAFGEGEQAYRGELVKLSKQLVQQFHQLLRCALGGQAGEAHNVCKQDAAREGQSGGWLAVGARSHRATRQTTTHVRSQWDY